jgi:hypothetical protein
VCVECDARGVGSPIVRVESAAHKKHPTKTGDVYRSQATYRPGSCVLALAEIATRVE